MKGPLLGLTRFDWPIKADWQAEQFAQLTASERARLARIDRPIRRAQFIVGHYMLRRLLAAVGLPVQVDVGHNNAPVVNAGLDVYLSVAHSNSAVAAIVTGEPVGIDLESPRDLHDPRAAAALLNMPSDAAVDSASVLRTWVAAEARLKGGERSIGRTWRTTWSGCELAVSGLQKLPLTAVLDVLTGNYNQTRLKWEAVTSPPCDRTQGSDARGMRCQ